MRYVVLVAVAGWLAFQGSALYHLFGGRVLAATLCEAAAIMCAGCLWVLGATRGSRQ